MLVIKFRLVMFLVLECPGFLFVPVYVQNPYIPYVLCSHVICSVRFRWNLRAPSIYAFSSKLVTEYADLHMNLASRHSFEVYYLF